MKQTISYAAHLPLLEVSHVEYMCHEKHDVQPNSFLFSGNLAPLIDAQNKYIHRQMKSYQYFMQSFMAIYSQPMAAKKYPGPKFSREDLEVLSSGKISSRFGEWFSELDQYERLIRMPEPPLLLADRVLGIDAKPASFEKGSIWTETDVKEDSWYLHQGRMPSGIMIESGQADLLLISWLGFDFYNRGERVYRLLGCELTFFGELAKPGDTLHFDIHVDAHAKQGDIRLFFFHYDCHVKGELRMRVRHGQAGFFTDEELKDSGGVLWDVESTEIDQTLKVEKPLRLSSYQKFSQEQIQLFAHQQGYACFGEGFEYLQTHTRTPTLPSDQLLLIHEITHFDVAGSPWKRGYMRAIQNIQSNDWFFNGHFKNDPCMPGTLMLEAGLQVMMMYMAATGCTLHKDGWRFEPVPEKTYKLTCRGQVIPSSKQVVYEIFVTSLEFEPRPMLQAHLLGTVDGLKAFHTTIALRLVPAWPLEEMMQNPHRKDSSVFHYDYYSLLACALGKPSDAFGDMYRVFDDGMRVARLPGPPYHFISRILHINAEKNSLNSNAELVVEWDIDANGWYFKNNSAPVLPFCVLLEAGLQPCGWLASYLGCALVSQQELFYRNLDGTGVLHRMISPLDKSIKTIVNCVGLSRVSKTLIISFKVNSYINEECVYSMDTVFGFFPAESFEQQEGLPITPEDKAEINKSSDFYVDLKKSPVALLPKNELLMIDKITGYWQKGGSQYLGMMRAEKTVDPAEWFFKAHFFQDPVQPGSLGIEAIIQLVQFYMIHKGYHVKLKNPVFEPIGLEHAMTWKYRGQVVPKNKLIKIVIDILDETKDNVNFMSVTVCASLWCDEKRIYEIKNLCVKLVEG